MSESQNPISLKCPSCGSSMNAPDNQGISECPYCHTKIIVPQNASAKEQLNISRYEQLCAAAKLAENHQEVLKYCTAILEIDPKNRNAWIDKAFATARLTTENNDRFPESTSYLKQVEQFYPNDSEIIEKRKKLEDMQFDWYKHMAYECNVRSANALNSMMQGLGIQYGLDAMNYYVKALNIVPDDIQLLKSVKLTAEADRLLGIQLPSEVQVLLERLQKIEDKQTALQRLPAWQAELQKLKNEMAKLENKRGFFVKMDKEDVQKDIKRVSTEVNRLQELANYQIPTRKND